MRWRPGRESTISGYSAGAVDDAFHLHGLPLPFVNDRLLTTGNLIEGRWRGAQITGFEAYGGTVLALSCAIEAVSADCPAHTIGHESHRHWIARHAGSLMPTSGRPP